MNSDPLQMLIAYKAMTIGAGCFFCWLGYRLYMRGHTHHSGFIETQFGRWRLLLDGVAPGILFMLAGGLLVGLTIYRGISYSPHQPAAQPFVPLQELNLAPPADTDGTNEGPELFPDLKLRD